MSKNKIILPFFTIFVIFILTLAIVWTGNNRNQSQNTNQLDQKITVSTSFYPLYFLAKSLGGDKITVQNITPSGAEPHDYEPTTTQIQEIYKSKILIFQGAGLDPWASKIENDLNKSGVKTIEISKNFDLQKADHKDDGEDHADEKDEDSTDPHIWLDPVLMQKQAQIIADELVKVDSQNQSFYQQNLKTLQEKILSLDQDYSKELKVCQQSTIFTSHEAFSYLAKRYNFKVESISGISPDQEPTSQDLARLTALVKNLRAKYILTESLVDTKLADTLAKETGALTLTLNTIEGLTMEQIDQNHDYLSLMWDNLKVLKKALECT